MPSIQPYYQDDAVSLYHGDCRELTDWLAADVLVTDPPYGIRMETFQGDRRAHANAGRKKDAIAGDTTTDARDAVLDMWGPRPAIVFGSWRIPRPTGTRSLLIWHKDGAFSGPLNAAFFTNHEEVYVLGDAKWRRSAPPLRSVITTTEHRSQASRDIGHPTPKPVHLMETLIDRCPPGVIADPFAGSGSTLVAAKQLGRNAIGVELEERYCEVIAKRLAQGVLDFGEVSA